MNRERVGALLLRAYPPGFLATRGEEMLGTLLDAGEDSAVAFARGVMSLLVGGLRSRACENARIGAGRLVADGFCQAAVLWSVLELLRNLDERYFAPPIWYPALLAGVLLFAALGRDRLGGLCGMALSVYVLVHEYSVPLSGPEPVLLGHPGLVFVLDNWVGPLVCFTIMVLKPRLRAHHARRLLWLTPVAALALAPTPPGVLVALSLLFYLALPLVGILLLAVDPRLAIASAVFWADITAAATLGHTRLGLITIPIVLLSILITIGRGRAMSPRAPA